MSAVTLGLAVSGFSLLSVAPVAAQSLTNAILFSSESSGNASGGSYWNTQSSDGIFDLWITQGSTLVNGPTDALAGINIPLTSGTYTYNLTERRAPAADTTGSTCFSTMPPPPASPRSGRRKRRPRRPHSLPTARVLSPSTQPQPLAPGRSRSPLAPAPSV